MSEQKPLEMCGPHLTCVSDEVGVAKCQKITEAPTDHSGESKDPNFCMARRHEYEVAKEKGSLGIAQMYPECDAGGYYAPRQCLPGTVCYCSNLMGERIFGLALTNEYQDCACARDIARIQEFGFTGRLPHCLPNGDYDELQCVVRTCFCRSHPETVFAMHKMNDSACFDPKIHIFDPEGREGPRYYMKDCELQRAKIEVQIAEAELEGTKMIVADIPTCDPDGNFAPIQTDFNRLYCADQNGNQIETYEAEKFTAAATGMNCYCARAKLLLSNSATGKPKCCSNGNYKPWQCIGDTCFCVNSLGQQDTSIPQVYVDDRHLLDCYPPTDVDPEDGTEPPCVYE
ncbi:Thyroglobulin [Orchesella cincta]|uniref:Thyroglobulin n=1 Tax=Orchesella cincta TaxID=48709 RepID=A0A1D2N8T0_ORCCI|nr:Thyroglobulin [Orchesella cincta]